jgi:YVTN family beta-propeller protein
VTVEISSAPYASITITLSVDGDMPVGKGRRPLHRVQSPYRVSARGGADSFGHYVGSVAVSYPRPGAFQVTLSVSAQSPQGRTTRSTHLTLRPPCGGHAVSGLPLTLCTVAVGRMPLDVAVDPSLGHLFVVNNLDGTASMLDAQTGTLLHVAHVGQTPWRAAVDARTHRVFVLTEGDSRHVSGSVAMLDARSGALVRTASVGKDPIDLAIDERTNRVFVANLFSNSVSVVDGSTGRLLRTIGVGTLPNSLAIDRRFGLVYVANSRGKNLSLIDARRGVVVRTVALRANPVRLVVDEANGRVLVGTTNGEISAFRGGSFRPLGRVRLGATPIDLVPAPRGNRLFAALLNSPRIAVVDTGAWRIVGRIDVGRNPLRLAIDATGTYLFSSNYIDNTVGVVKIRSGVRVTALRAGQNPWVLVADPSRPRVFVASRGGNSISIIAMANAGKVR